MGGRKALRGRPRARRRDAWHPSRAAPGADTLQPESSAVILLHGLWLRAFTLARLARTLRGHGYRVHGFNYRSLREDPRRIAERLAERVRAERGPVHLVGHSLGGMVALSATRTHSLPVHRIVCLGSPLRGSAVARRLGRIRFLRALLGRARRFLGEGVESWDGEAEVGVIAGSRSIGLGFIVGGLEKPHDGTVAVSETCLPGIADHLTLPTTHTGLLFSRDAAQLALRFLQSGRFQAGSDPGG